MYTHRTRPAAVAARQWTGENVQQMRAFAKGNFDAVGDEDRQYVDDPEWTAQVMEDRHSTWVGLHAGDWVIRDASGLRRCKDEEFRQTYMTGDAFASAVAAAVRSFDFGNYGLDEVDDVIDEEWADRLAAHITATLEGNS
ncbi:hypothetical protein [Nocardiopsis synnemataformans]|uniref:hypothetical protein n=1 Tax=Nocardiopsis synnemataformans TaxID=61305 RepID=UPI003EB86995